MHNWKYFSKDLQLSEGHTNICEHFWKLLTKDKAKIAENFRAVARVRHWPSDDWWLTDGYTTPNIARRNDTPVVHANSGRIGNQLQLNLHNNLA